MRKQYVFVIEILRSFEVSLEIQSLAILSRGLRIVDQKNDYFGELDWFKQKNKKLIDYLCKTI